MTGVETPVLGGPEGNRPSLWVPKCVGDLGGGRDNYNLCWIRKTLKPA